MRVAIVFCVVQTFTIFLALADADPLGVNQNVTFDEVGGLDDRTSSISFLGVSANSSL